MSTLATTEGPNSSTYVGYDSKEIDRLGSKRVVFLIVDKNRLQFIVSRSFAAQITERDVKNLAGQLETTLRVVCAQVGNILR